MKNKIFLVSIIGLLFIIVIFSSIGVSAYIQQNDNFASAKTSFANSTLNVVSVDKIYTKLDTSDIEKLKINTEKKAISVANNYLKNMTSKLTKISGDEEFQIKYSHSGLMLRNEVTLDNSKYSMTLNADTGELINYSKHISDFPKCTLSEYQIKTIAQELFEQADLCDAQAYEMVYLEEYDEGIWRAGFIKKYGDLLNYGESVKFHFIPETREIWILGINNIEYANNEVLVSEATVRNIANKYLEKSVATDMKIYLDIVRPNELFSSNELRKDKVYSFGQVMRKAYVCEFNNDAKTQLYIDCTTGQLIGGDAILGGEF